MAAGASGFLGLSPWSSDPMRSLTAVAEQPQGPAADPATTGALPPQAPVAAPASGGGMGDMLGRLFGGGSRPGDDAVDPNTGATVGQVRQVNMQSMQKLGLILLAAGGRMTNDQRASILSRAGDALDNSGQLNEFARMRLQMANARLAERKQAQAEQKSAYVRALLGGSGAATLGTPGTAPAAASASTGGPAPMQDAASAGPSPAASAPGAAPAAGGPLDGISPGLRAIAGGMDDDKALDTLARARSELDNQESYGAQYQDQATGQLMAPVMRGGKQVRVAPIGHLLGAVTEETGPDGATRRVTRTGNTVTGITDVQEAPEVRENRQALMSAARADRDTLQKDYHESVQKSVQTYDKIAKVRADVMDGKGLFGAVQGNNYFRGAVNALADMNPKFKSWAGDLNVTSNFERVLKEGVAGVIKNFNGSQGVSNADRDFAVQLMQAAATNNREGVLNALNNAMGDSRSLVSRYNENAKRHNDNLSDFQGSLRARFTAPTVDRDFDREESEFQASRQQQKPAAAPAPEQPQAQRTPPREAPMQIGAVVGGYRWNGGPRGLQSSWEKVQ